MMSLVSGCSAGTVTTSRSVNSPAAARRPAAAETLSETPVLMSRAGPHLWIGACRTFRIVRFWRSTYGVEVCFGSVGVRALQREGTPSTTDARRPRRFATEPPPLAADD